MNRYPGLVNGLDLIRGYARKIGCEPVFIITGSSLYAGMTSLPDSRQPNPALDEEMGRLGWAVDGGDEWVVGYRWDA